LTGGKAEEWIKVYGKGEYGFVQDGKPVYPEYRDWLHCKPFELARAVPISIGIDFGLRRRRSLDSACQPGRPGGATDGRYSAETS
jgi:hypothetical protein